MKTSRCVWRRMKTSRERRTTPQSEALGEKAQAGPGGEAVAAERAAFQARHDPGGDDQDGEEDGAAEDSEARGDLAVGSDSGKPADEEVVDEEEEEDAPAGAESFGADEHSAKELEGRGGLAGLEFFGLRGREIGHAAGILGIAGGWGCEDDTSTGVWAWIAGCG